MDQEAGDIPAIRASCGGPSLTVLRQLETGELPADQREHVEAHAEGCLRCQAALHEFRADAAALRVALPFAALDARLEQRSQRGPGWRRLVFGLLAPAAALTAALLIAPRFRGQEESTSHPLPGNRLKGGPSFEFVVKSGDNVREGHSGDRLRAGDSLRFRYNAGGEGYVLIAGVDADANVFPYLTSQDRSAPSAPGSTLAPNSVVLDGDPRPERVFAIYSSVPIGVDEVRAAAVEALHQAGSIERLSSLPGFQEQETILLNKASP